MKTKLFVVSLSLLFVLAGIGPLLAADVTLSWSATGVSGLAGYKIYYGTTSKNYTSSTDVGNVTSSTVSGLLSGSTYYFEIAAYDSSKKELGYSNEVSTEIGPAITSSSQPSVLTSTSAAISWTTDVPSTSQVEYGTQSGSYPSSSGDTILTTTHSVQLSGLTPNTSYYYREMSTANGFTTTSAESKFTTLADSTTTAPPPATSIDITNVAATLINKTKVSISWTTNVPADSQVLYGTVPNSYSSSTSVSTTPVTSHSVTLTGLRRNTTYYFLVKSSAAGVQNSASGTFTTR